MKYRICEANTADALAVIVEAALSDGWTLAGGVSVSTYQIPETDRYGSGESCTYAQALIRAT